jgi:hypothetical protein
MTLNPCKKCGQAPSLRTIDVTSTAPAHYLRCECGRGTNWHYKPDACAAEWNMINKIEQPEQAEQAKPVQSKQLARPVQPKQPTHAAMVLARKKGELAYAG